MAEERLEKLAEYGQSIWIDSISLAMIASGKLEDRIRQGLRGLTSNPTIFDKAISQTADYDDAITRLVKTGEGTMDIYDELTVSDIRSAADLFSGVYEKTKRLDGYVSLEVDPKISKDIKASIEEGRRLFWKVARPNLMVKIPATKEGYKIIEVLISEGVNVNATLIFSPEQYRKTAESFIKGLIKLEDSGGDLTRVHSVASVFVSRIDTAVDDLLTQKIKEDGNEEEQNTLTSLKGRAATHNAEIIYDHQRHIFTDEKFKRLKEMGANTQRVLWASTSTKNPDYHDLMYVDGLIAPNTVNTLPESTYDAFLDHGDISQPMKNGKEKAEEYFLSLKSNGIDMDTIHQDLLVKGVAAFEKSFESLLRAIEEKAKILV